MALYPVQLATFRSRISRFAYLGKRTQDELQQALDTAQGDIELYAQNAGSGVLAAALDRAAARLVLE